MQKPYQITFTIMLALALSGCATIMGFIFEDKKVEMFAAETDPIKIQEYLEWSVNRLNEEDEDSPDLLARLMPIAVTQANNIDLFDVKPSLYSALTDSLVNIAKDGVQTTDQEEWEEDGFPYDVTIDYLRASAAYNLGKLDGDTIASQLLVILRKVDSPGVQTVVIKSMLDRVNSYRVSPEIQAQAVTALSSVDVANLAEDTPLSQLVYALENELVTLAIINRVLAKKDIYQLSVRNLNYILDVNEGLFIHHLDNPGSINKSELIKNSRLLSSLVLPRQAQYDGVLPKFTSIQLRAQRLLLQYVPGLYYYSMYENAPISDYSLGQLMASLAFLDRHDDYATKAKGKLVAKGDDEHLFFNHHQVMNAEIYATTKLRAKELVFTSLQKRVETRPYAYIDFIYSFLYLNYPDEFAAYLIKAVDVKYRNANLDQLQHYYGLRLSKDSAVTAKHKAQIVDKISAKQLSRSLAYNDSEFKRYTDKVMPVFVANQPLALLKGLTSRNQNVKKQAGISHLVNYYISALEKQAIVNRKTYLAPAGRIIALRKESDTKKIFGSLMALPLSETSSMFEQYAFSDSRTSLASDYLFLGNYLTKHKTGLTPNYASRYAKLFSSGVRQAKSEDASLHAGQQGIANLSSDADLQQIKAALSGRFKKISF
ncbi:hypothetical protein OA92_03460 [Marinomonas sp. SBI22]|uniref:hypothetical protein n=1 Tax=unclassified Marinomonas TaxID=196814 RepID=UPI0007AF3502|nr:MULTISPECIES: hypothetical protein [unclassified Marinomonas]KZM44928.1 hypothetical protein OA92_03460 [Marinomonas sp. SBI22]KZM46627.1 hypothetical protein OA91_02520 [Marinomonas sp. SBI8L]